MDGRYLSTRTIEKILEHACEKAGIRKDISVHTLRHYATHFIMILKTAQIELYIGIKDRNNVRIGKEVIRL